MANVVTSLTDALSVIRQAYQYLSSSASAIREMQRIERIFQREGRTPESIFNQVKDAIQGLNNRLSAVHDKIDSLVTATNIYYAAQVKVGVPSECGSIKITADNGSGYGKIQIAPADDGAAIADTDAFSVFVGGGAGVGDTITLSGFGAGVDGDYTVQSVGAYGAGFLLLTTTIPVSPSPAWSSTATVTLKARV